VAVEVVAWIWAVEVVVDRLLWEEPAALEPEIMV
jgi:hypothetical protein